MYTYYYKNKTPDAKTRKSNILNNLASIQLEIKPTNNLILTAANIIDKVRQAYRHSNIKMQIIIIEDNSPDGTRLIAHKLATLYPNVVPMLIICRKLLRGQAKWG